MRKCSSRLYVGLALFTTAVVLGAGCQSQPVQAPAADAQPEYAPIATVKDLMLSIIDPSADVVWEAVAVRVTDTGTDQKVPQSEEEWIDVRRGAVRLVEATNLLMVPGRRVARPGEKSEAPGVELEPEEMDVLIAKDIPGWNARTKALREAGLAALQAIDARDTQKVYDVGDQIEMACENCHLNYWYPNQVLPPGYGPERETTK